MMIRDIASVYLFDRVKEREGCIEYIPVWRVHYAGRSFVLRYSSLSDFRASPVAANKSKRKMGCDNQE